MNAWWSGLEGLTKLFYSLAAFFSVIFLWQFLSSLIGLGGDSDADVDVDIDGIEGHAFEDAAESVASFRVLSLRAILAFCTLFTWMAAMYRDGGKPWPATLMLASLWGLAGWVVVAVMVYFIRQLAESGNAKVATCVGTEGTVYLDIPAGGAGEVRVMVSGAVSRVKARGVGEAIPSGTRVTVTRVLDPTTVEVTLVDSESDGKGS
jgi:hypothetical protein